MERPRLRDIKNLSFKEVYQLNRFPNELIKQIGGYLVYLLYINRKDITGTDWGDAFASAINAEHLDSPVGIADVVLGKQCWSMKTVKMAKPFSAEVVRLISGRCSPDYSYGISDPHKDIQRTGEAILGIWNERVNIATDHYSQVRTAVLIRGYELDSFVLFEEETARFKTADYHWDVNTNGNLIGLDNSDRVCFTWQPHGAQFTIHTTVPNDATHFQIKVPEIKLNKDNALSALNFDDSWVTILK